MATNEVIPISVEQEIDIRGLLTALEMVAQGVIILDAGGNVTFENELANAWLHSECPVLRHDDLDAISALAIQGHRTTRTFEFMEPRRLSLQVTGIPITAESGGGGDVESAVVVLDDITERRHFEDGRRDFIANVSHELKTPVGALGLLAETLMIENDPAVVRRLIKRLHVEAVRVGTVIDDLLSLSRIESGPVQFEEMNARRLVDQAINRVDVTAQHHNNLIQVKGDMTATVFGSHRDVVSAIQHLLENALKYSSEGSPVDIEISNSEEWTEIAVTDHGVGIQQKYVERIFERFYRVDDARTRATGGTGLGLSIVRHVVQAHGGDIRVQSQEGSGSTFTMRLAATPSSAAQVLGKGRIVEGGTDG